MLAIHYVQKPDMQHNKDASEYSTLIFNSSHSFAEIKVVGSKLTTL